MKSQPTLFQTIRHEIAKEKKLLRRKKCFLKFKVYLCLILPVVIVLLTVKVIKTYLKIKLKNTVIPGLKKKIVPKPLKKEPAGEETVVPQPVSEPYQPIRIKPVTIEPVTIEPVTIESVTIEPTEYEPIKITTDDRI